MAFFKLEDLESSVEVLAFPKTMAQSGSLIQDDAILVVKGRLNNSGDDLKVRSFTIVEPDLTPRPELRLTVPAGVLSRDTVGKLKKILINHPGSAPVFVEMTSDGYFKMLRLDDQFRVDRTSALLAEIRNLLGASAVA